MANLQTVGFKSEGVQFNDLVASQMDINGQATALATAKPVSVRDFLQGGIQVAQSPLDAAVAGHGFFVTSSASGPLYTRDGEFQIGQNSSGDRVLMSSSGNTAEGYSIALDGTVGASLSDIVLPAKLPPVATSEAGLTANLDALAPAGGSAEFSQTIHDSQGVQHALSLQFTHGTTAGSWLMTAQQDGKALPGVTTLQFDSSGTLQSPASARINAGVGNISLSLFDVKGNSLITQYGAPSNSSGFSVNGSAAADVNGYSIGDGGVVYAKASDGQNVAVAKLALANIANPDSMLAQGHGDFQVTQNTMGYKDLSTASGASAYFGSDASQGSRIVGQAVEGSNVDLAAELANLMVYQHSYQANAKALTTGDQMMQTLEQLIQ